MKSRSPLTLTLTEGEGYRIEFKEKTADLDREIVAFANGAGGSIYIGVNDHGDIIGVDISNQLKSQIIDIARNCDPGIKITLIPHPEAKVLEVQVDEGLDKPYRCRDGFFLRIGPSSQKLRRNEIVNFINDAGKIHFDETLGKHFEYPQDFSNETLKEFLKKCGVETQHPDKEVLLSLGAAIELAGKLAFTNAGVLFFAKEPQQFHPESYITAVKYQSQDRFNIIDKKDFKGSLIEQIEAAMAFLVRHMSVATQVEPGLQSLAASHQLYDYPLVALREAIVNAVAHRDYGYDNSHIYVHMYPDRVEIENPGGLFRGLSVQNLGKRSVRRNRLIADLLHRAHYIERVGSGFDRMRHALAENNNPDLEVSATNFFNIRFLKRVQKPEVLNLSSRQLLLYQLLQARKAISKKEAAIALNVSGDTALRELNVLVAQNLVNKQGTGKATMYVLKK